jgi:hypothetical protein
VAEVGVSWCDRSGLHLRASTLVEFQGEVLTVKLLKTMTVVTAAVE